MSAIVGMTLKEVARRRILLVSLVLAGGFLVLYGLGVHFAYVSAKGEGAAPGSMTALLRELLPNMFFTLALFFGTFILAFLAVMSAVGTISMEIEQGIMQGLAPRPIRRSTIVLAKFTGYALVMAAFSLLLYLGVVLTTFFATGKAVAVDFRVMGLYVLHPIVLLAVTMLGTTFLPTMANAIAAFMLYALSIMGGTVEQLGYLLEKDVLINVGIVTSLVMPADSLYRKMVNLTLSSASAGLVSTGFLGPFGSSGEPSAYMVVYALAYVMALVAAATAVFSRRDI